MAAPAAAAALPSSDVPEPAIEIVQDVTPELVEAMAGLLPQLSRSAPAPTAEELAEIVDGDATSLLVALLDGRIVGSLTLVVFRIPTGVRAWIEDVVVDASARGAGVGGALNRAALGRGPAPGRPHRRPDVPSLSGGGQPSVPAPRVRAPGDQRLPLGLNATRQGASWSSAAWRTCQSRSADARDSASSTSGPSKGARAMTARRRTVALSPVAARMAGRPGRIADGPERRHGRFANEGVVVPGGEGAQAGHHRRPVRIVEATLLAAGEGHHLDHRGVVVVERGEEGHGAVAGGQLGGPAPHARAGVGERGLQQRAVEPTHAPERSERGRPHGGLLVGQRVQGTADVPLVPGQRRAPPTLRCAGRPWRPGAGVHDRPARSVRAATTSTATIIASSAPRMTPMTPSPVNAKRRFQMGVRRYSIVGSSTTTMVSSG